MSAPRTLRQRTKHIELLQKQQADLLKMADRHWRWMKDADDTEIRRAYRGIANLIRKSAELYNYLLDVLQEQQHKK